MIEAASMKVISYTSSLITYHLLRITYFLGGTAIEAASVTPRHRVYVCVCGDGECTNVCLETGREGGRQTGNEEGKQGKGQGKAGRKGGGAQGIIKI